MIEDVVLCWLQMNAIRAEYIRVTTTGPSHRIDVGLYDDRRLTSASKRYARAVEMFARVRRFGITLPCAPEASTEDETERTGESEGRRAVG